MKTLTITFVILFNLITFNSLALAAEGAVSAVTIDARVFVDRNLLEYKALDSIGIVKSEGKKFYGTGFLVDDCHVLTNNHVVFEDEKFAKNGMVVNFSVGQTDSTEIYFSKSNIAGKVVAHGNFEMTRNSQNGDWALINLYESVGKVVGYIPMYQMDMTKMKGRKVITAGFPGDRTNDGKDFSKIYADINCKIIGASLFGYSLHTCQANGGQSGSPLLAKGNDGKYYAIAMISGNKGFDMSRSEDPDRANVAVSFTSLRVDSFKSEGDKIVDAINADPCK